VRAGPRGNPKVTGVLPVALERATAIMQHVARSVKEYVCVMQLHQDVSEERLLEALEAFKGEIFQKPPVKSSVKRRLRTRKVYDLRVLEKRGRLVLVKVTCDPGTYVRKLCHDIGILLGTGAHMAELRRVRSGPFTESSCTTMHELSEAVYLWKSLGDESLLRKVVLPVEKAACALPKLLLKSTAVAAVAHGAYLAAPGLAAFTEDAKPGRLAAMVAPKGELVGLAVVVGDPLLLTERGRGIVARPTRILIDRSAYPKAWKRREGGRA